MKLFGNSKQSSYRKKEEHKAAPLHSSSFAPVEEDDREVLSELKILLDEKETDDAAFRTVQPSREKPMPELTYRQHETNAERAPDLPESEEDEMTLAMPGWLKGTLLLLASAIIFVLVLFGVNLNLR